MSWCYRYCCLDLSLTAIPGGMDSLMILTVVNLFNYIDRYLPSALKSQIQEDLGLTDLQTSLPLTAFILVYMFTSPLFGYLADHGWSRKRLIAFGVFVWSIAAASSSLATNYAGFLVTRCVVGIGEAAYGTISPAMIADYFPPAYRTKALSFFYLAIPVGSALGYGLGGELGSIGVLGWRGAFAICALPGVGLAIASLFLADPERGSSDNIVAGSEVAKLDKVSVISPTSYVLRSNVEMPSVSTPSQNIASANSDFSNNSDDAEITPPLSPVPKIDPLPLSQVIWILYNNKDYFYVVTSTTFIAFGAGGMADWFPTFMERYYGYSTSGAALIIGGMTVVGGIFGVTSGAAISRIFKEQALLPNAEMFVQAVSMIFCTFFAFLAFYSNSNATVTVFLLFLTQYFLWFYTGPSNSIVTSVDLSVRTRAFGLLILINHGLGDALSPSVIGALSDSFDLRAALAIIPFMLAGSALSFTYAYFVCDDKSWMCANPGISNVAALWHFLKCGTKSTSCEEST